MAWRYSWALPLALVLGASIDAQAQDGLSAEEVVEGEDAVASSSSDDEEARVLFQAGEMAYRNAQFDRALDYFQRAYELSQRDGLLFNIASMHDRLNHPTEALAAYRAYLEAFPDADNEAFVRNRITALENAPATGSNEFRIVVEDPPGPEPEGPSIAGIVLVSAGGAFILAGVGTTFWWVNRIDAADQCVAIGCMNPGPLANERDAAAALSVTAYALGATGIVVGAILLASGGDEAREGGASVACAPSFGGVACRGRF